MPLQPRPSAVPVLLLSLAIAAPAVAQQGTLLVANRAGGSVSFIDLPTGLEIARVPIGSVIPHEVDVSADGRRALTTEYGSDDDRGRHVVLIDVASAAVVSRQVDNTRGMDIRSIK